MIIDMSLNQEHRERVAAWIETLRSGSYRQGTGALRISNANGPDKYCCMGVSCDMMPGGSWRPPHSDDALEYPLAPGMTPPVAGRAYSFMYDEQSAGAMPPDPWYEWIFGVGSDSAQFTDLTAELAGMNDVGVPFDRIADALAELISDEPIDWPTWLDRHREPMTP